MALTLKPTSACAFDQFSLGEIMLRLDPGEGRIRTARTFTAWEGGGEYNVARGLKRCFGLQTSIVTVLADNPVGRLVEDLGAHRVELLVVVQRRLEVAGRRHHHRAGL